MEIKRDRYLKQLIDSRQNGFIKVVTGIRRCGKSYLLNVLFYHYLLDNGVAEDHIIRIDLEDRLNKELRNPDAMLHYVHDRIKDNDLYYIIIDEVQLMDEFVDVLNSFRHIENADTYVTGSNSLLVIRYSYRVPWSRRDDTCESTVFCRVLLCNRRRQTGRLEGILHLWRLASCAVV